MTQATQPLSSSGLASTLKSPSTSWTNVTASPVDGLPTTSTVPARGGVPGKKLVAAITTPKAHQPRPTPSKQARQSQRPYPAALTRVSVAWTASPRRSMATGA
ncbi:uncharacterized protein BKA55DRAFT_559539 [Fusarium redolens]|uniref:Uncharacterized protein n=1 Tax=Fusarium redolens TaxID=48865 RepID=A0A9P9HQF0_FUSRE|nr:uncharacterized protein BKA55DRAFT_559539 [Fusarium redolens]KAH7260664.1 hypothetical protein BKA55DRAFT_559539 [Fusarium redolens]